MKRAYEKPVALANEELMEGVYMTSGDTTGSDCYTVTTNIHQRPETGRGDYRIQVNGHHFADEGDGHHSGEQHLILAFNQPVNYISSNGKLTNGDGTSTIDIEYHYHNSAGDNIGLGDVVVTSEAGLSITGSKITCNHDCGQH